MVINNDEKKSEMSTATYSPAAVTAASACDKPTIKISNKKGPNK